MLRRRSGRSSPIKPPDVLRVVLECRCPRCAVASYETASR
jgi:hypothetical protein